MNSNHTYLFIARDRKDARLLDAAIKNGKLGYNKLGPNVYLGFFSERHQQTYQMLVGEFHVKGEINWIELPHPEVTK